VPLISEDSLRKVQEASDIVGLAESYGLKLKRTGSSFLAICPFHNEKTPSFNINPQMQIFKCFGCGVGGGSIKFVQLMERCEFPEAVELLANKSGIDLEYEGGSTAQEASGKSDNRKALRWANRIALEYFRRALKDPREGRVAREYLLSRGFNEETIAAWGLGWSPDLWDGLMNYYLSSLERMGGAHKREKAIEVGREAGIFRYNEEKDRTYDAFRGRVMFPIFDNQQRPIGFGGRVLEEKPEAGGKYLNTSETPVFQKRSLLFGLNFAAKEIGLTKTAIVVEGYTDTIMCHQYGIRNVVATLGTSLTHEHVRLLRRYIQNEGRVVALFDNDNAGKKATDRAIEIFMEEGVTLHVLQNLDVKDAGEYLPKYGAEAFNEFLGKAKDSFSFALEKHLGQNFSGDLGRKAAAVEALMELVNRCPNAIRREMMRGKVAEVAGVPEETLPQPDVRKSAYLDPKEDKPFKSKSFTEHIPLKIDPRKEGVVKTEKRLLYYIYAEKEWCDKICDVFPPCEWFDHSACNAAEILRDEWFKGQKPKLEDILLRVVDEPVREVLIDLIDTDKGPELRDEELNSLLNKVEVLKLEERKQSLELLKHDALAESDNERLDKLLVESIEIDRKIRLLGGI